MVTERPGGAWLDGLLLSGTALLAYLLLAQETLYRADGHIILARLADRGASGSLVHVLFMPALIAFHDAIGPLGLAPHRVATVFAALTTALAVLVFRLALAARPRGEAALATALVAVCPPVVFFATVVEMHAPFFLAAQICFLVTEALVRRSTLPRALLLGACLALACLLHATGLALPCLLLPWLAFGTAGRHRAALVALVAFAVALLAAATGLRSIGLVNAGAIGTDLVALVGAMLPRVVNAPAILWHEAAVPYLPLSLAILVACRHRPLRQRLAVLAAALAVYTVMTAMLIGGTRRHECGAYLLPLAGAAASLVARAMRPRTALLLVVVSAVLGVVRVRGHDVEGPRYREFVADLQRAAGPRRPRLMTLDLHELAACLVAGRGVVSTWYLAAETQLPPDRLAAVLQILPGVLRGYRAGGDEVLLSRVTEQAFGAPVFSTSGPRFLALLRERCALEPIEAGSFRGYSVRAR